MNRREFVTQAGLAAGGLLTLPSCFSEQSTSPRTTNHRLRWTREAKSRMFSAVSWDGTPLVLDDAPGLLDGGCRLLAEAPAQVTWLRPQRAAARHGPLDVELRHQLRDSGRGLGEDLLEAKLAVRNLSGQPQRVELAFVTSVQPSAQVDQQHVYVPLNAAGGSGDSRFAALGVKQFLKDCNQRVGRGDFQAHYLEPMASYPSERETRALLLAPVVDISHPQAAVRVGLFTSSLEPRRLSTLASTAQTVGWHIGRCVTSPRWATSRGGPARGISSTCGRRR